MKKLLIIFILFFITFKIYSQNQTNEDDYRHTLKQGRVAYRDYTNRDKYGNYNFFKEKTEIFVCNYFNYDGLIFIESYINNEKYYLLINHLNDELTEKYKYLKSQNKEKLNAQCDISKRKATEFFINQKKELDSINNEVEKRQKKELDSLNNVIENLKIERVKKENKINKMIDSLFKLNTIWIYDWEIEDANEYIDGTNFEIEILNSSSVDIKYIWISIEGYNPVDDKVIDPITKKSIKQVTCVGPIKKNEIGNYEFKFLWNTDLVNTAKIVQIKIQYMNGAIKIVSKPNDIMFDQELRNIYQLKQIIDQNN